MAKARKERKLLVDDQYQPLLSDGFESIGILKDYIQGDRYGGAYDVGMPLVCSFDGTAFDVTFHRTIDIESFLADPNNYSYMRRVETFINRLIKTWKKFGPSLSFKKEENVIKWSGKDLTLENLTEVALQLQTVGTMKRELNNRLYLKEYGHGHLVE